MERIMGMTDGEHSVVSIRCDPLRYVLKVTCVGKRWVHGSIRPVESISLSRPDRGLSEVSLKSPPRIMSWFIDWKKCLIWSVRSWMKACRGCKWDLPSWLRPTRCWCHAVKPMSLVGRMLTWYAEMIVSGFCCFLLRVTYVHLPILSPPRPVGCILPTVFPTIAIAVPPGRYDVAVCVWLEVIWRLTFSRIVLRIADCIWWCMSWWLILIQCSVIQRMSVSVAICSAMIVVMFWAVWFVPTPLMFWNISRMVFFGFSDDRVLPIHEVVFGGIRLLFGLFLETWLFSVLVAESTQVIVVRCDILMFAPVWFTWTTTGAG